MAQMKQVLDSPVSRNMNLFCENNLQSIIMRLGRLEFLRLSSLALAGLVIDPRKAVAVNNDVYVNRKLGILFSKPAGWEFVSVRDYDQLKEKQILKEGIEEIKDDLWQVLVGPACLATKYAQDDPKYHGIFSPTIMLNVAHRAELDELQDAPLADIIAASKEAVAGMLRDFRVVKVHEPYLIDGCGALEFDSEYTFEHAEMTKPVTVQMKSIKIEHNGFLYDFDCHQCSAQNQTAHAEFEAFRKSIRLI
jgi:hypothetical protein